MNLIQISKGNRKLWWRKKNIFTVSLLTEEAPFTGDGDVGRGGSYSDKATGKGQRPQEIFYFSQTDYGPKTFENLFLTH